MISGYEELVACRNFGAWAWLFGGGVLPTYASHQFEGTNGWDYT